MSSGCSLPQCHCKPSSEPEIFKLPRPCPLRSTGHTRRATSGLRVRVSFQAGIASHLSFQTGIASHLSFQSQMNSDRHGSHHDLGLRRRQFQPETGIAVSQFHCQTGIAARSLSRVSHRHPSGPSHLSFQTGIARALFAEADFEAAGFSAVTEHLVINFSDLALIWSQQSRMSTVGF